MKEISIKDAQSFVKTLIFGQKKSGKDKQEWGNFLFKGLLIGQKWVERAKNNVQELIEMHFIAFES
jgi:hypothetical protein